MSHLLAVALVLTTAQYAAKHLGVERLHPASQNRRVGCQVLNLLTLKAERLNKLLRSAGTEELHALVVEFL